VWRLGIHLSGMLHYEHKSGEPMFEQFGPLDKDGEWCMGRLVRLYVRRLKPQRWVVVGLVCAKCRASVVSEVPETL
jgi:hypothetical protein